MEKSLELQEQLRRICDRVFPDEIKSGKLPPPSKKQEIILRQVMLLSFCDSIARKVLPGSLPSTSKEAMSRRKRLTAFESCDPNVPGLLYIHPQSTLYAKVDASSLSEFSVE